VIKLCRYTAKHHSLSCIQSMSLSLVEHRAHVEEELVARRQSVMTAARTRRLYDPRPVISRRGITVGSTSEHVAVVQPRPVRRRKNDLHRARFICATTTTS